ncbi:hypothetical protein BC937DRAFT_94330, partial [Endogone sp. FLAS-F59071]
MSTILQQKGHDSLYFGNHASPEKLAAHRMDRLSQTQHQQRGRAVRPRLAHRRRRRLFHTPPTLPHPQPQEVGDRLGRYSSGCQHFRFYVYGHPPVAVAAAVDRVKAGARARASPWPPPYTHPFEKEYAIPKECNNLQPIHRADINETVPRHFALKGPKDRVLTIFLWRQQTFGHANIPWVDYARDLCPYPPELGSFFIMYWLRHVQNGDAKWPEGWAPCWLWKINPESDGTVRTCQESGIKYRLTTNYTEFREADVVYMDYVFYEAEERPPFWNEALLPPKIGGQVWW